MKKGRHLGVGLNCCSPSGGKSQFKENPHLLSCQTPATVKEHALSACFLDSVFLVLPSELHCGIRCSSSRELLHGSCCPLPSPLVLPALQIVSVGTAAEKVFDRNQSVLFAALQG